MRCPTPVVAPAAPPASARARQTARRDRSLARCRSARRSRSASRRRRLAADAGLLVSRPTSVLLLAWSVRQEERAESAPPTALDAPAYSAPDKPLVGRPGKRVYAVGAWSPPSSEASRDASEPDVWVGSPSPRERD